MQIQGEAIGRRVKDVVKEAKYIETERIQNKAFYTGVLRTIRIVRKW